MANKTLLIGLDGATLTLVHSLAAEGTMPCVAQLMAEGARAPLRTGTANAGPAVWSVLVSGRSAGADGGGESLWSVAHRHGLRSIAVNVPGTWPAPDGCRSADPASVPRSDAGGRDAETRVEALIRRDRESFEVFRRLDGEGPAELSVLVFDGVGEVDRTVRTGSRRREYFRRLDGLIARCCERVGEAATVFVVGYGSGEGHGVWVARGPDIRAEEAPPMSLVDIAPTVLHGLGLTAAADMEGQVRVSTAAGPALGAKEETMIADRLRELGYIE